MNINDWNLYIYIYHWILFDNISYIFSIYCQRRRQLKIISYSSTTTMVKCVCLKVCNIFISCEYLSSLLVTFLNTHHLFVVISITCNYYCTSSTYKLPLFYQLIKTSIFELFLWSNLTFRDTEFIQRSSKAIQKLWAKNMQFNSLKTTAVKYDTLS